MDGAMILSADCSRIARANVQLVPEPRHPDRRDRDPPPHRRAGGQADRRPGDHDLRGARARRRPPPRPEAHARAGRARAPARRPGAADPRALQGPARRRERLAVRARGRGSRDRARRRHRPAARGDGAPHRGGDRGVRHRARRRRPSHPPPARGADGWGRGRPPPLRQGLLPPVDQLRAARRDDRARRISTPRPCSTSARWRRCCTCRTTPGSTPRSSRTATACSTRSRGCPRWSRTTWSTASRSCTRSCAPGVPDLVEVEGVGEARARAIKDGLARLAETSILERYV